MRITFVSNYINHHQIPFCNALSELLAGEGAGHSDITGIFTFIQTQKMEADRVQMGWHEEERPAYVKCYYEEEESCKELIVDSDVVIFGGVDDESYIVERLQAEKLTFRYCERLYKTGQWKAISPRGLVKKYQDHTRYRKSPVYLLCAGAYVASDYHIVRSYPGKMYCWGYFPETKHHDVDKLMENKGRAHLLWAGRMIDWKHPELALETAKYLKDRGLSYHMDIIGGGELQPMVEQLREEYQLQQEVTLLGYRSPEEVRSYMEQADIFLFTSDRQEGWGAVANEAMNSGCAVIADHMIGAVPYLIQNGENGMIYRSGDKEQLFTLAAELVENPKICADLGRKAYETIVNVWNAENAAKRLLEIVREKLQQGGESVHKQGGKGSDENPGILGRGCDGNRSCYAPGEPAPILSERAAKKLADRT